MSYFFLIPVSIGLGLIGLTAFFWALRHNQYDDLEGAAARILIASDAPDRRAEDGPNGKLAVCTDQAITYPTP